MKEGNNIQLKINVINQLKLLRVSTFKDKLCFLDEDIQNAQRAKAKKFKVTINSYEKQIIIENDGNILKNPQCLFSIAESGWDDEIKNTENPFGTGFFSNITVSNYIEIYSGYKHIVFDVDTMIKTKNTNIFVEKTNKEYKGFKLILNNFDFEEISSRDIKERIELLGQYIHELNVYYNNNLISKKDLTEGDNSVFQEKIEDDTFKGWISIGDNWCYNSKINIYYKGRLVTNLNNFPYIKGDIHISDKTLNLTSPDRKDIIKNNKLIDFTQLLNIYIEEMCNKALLEGNEEDIQEHSNGISYYIDKNKIKKLVKFATFKSNNKQDIEYLKGISIAKSKNCEIKNFKEYVLYLEKEAKEKNKSIEQNTYEINQEIIPKNNPERAKGIIEHNNNWIDGTSGYFKEAYIEQPKIKKEELIEKRGELLSITNEPTFWLSFNDIINNEYKLNIAKHYNLKIIVARNRIEEDLLKEMKDSDNILHISELDEKIIINANLYNMKLSIEEERAMMIFNMISTQILKQKNNLFKIGDLIVTKKIKVESIKSENELIEEDVSIVASKKNQLIYLDRSILNKNHLDKNLNEELNLEDYKFILSNLNNICEEITLLSLGYTKDEIFEKIVQCLGGAI